MSQKQNISVALQILAIQLTEVTYDGSSSRKELFERFITHFEAILHSITRLTHDSFPSSVKKTILASQLRGTAASWAWRNDQHDPLFRRMNYEEFKLALEEKFC